MHQRQTSPRPLATGTRCLDRVPPIRPNRRQQVTATCDGSLKSVAIRTLSGAIMAMASYLSDSFNEHSVAFGVDWAWVRATVRIAARACTQIARPRSSIGLAAWLLE